MILALIVITINDFVIINDDFATIVDDFAIVKKILAISLFVRNKYGCDGAGER